jgi:hypothetical protein
MKFNQRRIQSVLSLAFFLLIWNTNGLAQNWYLNDNSTEQDIFTLQSGSSHHHGNSPDQPLDSLVEILKRCKDGDRIYDDTGSYPEFNATGELLISLTKIDVIIHFSKKEIYPKNQFPPTVKVTAEEFYILNDQPVSREVYLQNLQKK